MIKLRYYSLQPTTGIKVPPQILFWKSSKKQRCSKILKILKKNICKTIPFSQTSQPFSPEFPTSKKTYLKKNVSCSCSEILGKLPREFFGKNVRKTAVLRVLESCQKKVFSSKAIQASLLPITILKTDSIANVCEDFQNFQNSYVPKSICARI